MRQTSMTILFSLFVVSFLLLPFEPASAQTPASVQTAAQASSSAQTPASAQTTTIVDPSTLLGATLPQVIDTFGPPRTVHAVRGPEAWQDDVVFVYDNLEFYWFKDRVWQVRALAAFGLNAGDSRETAISLLGEPLHRLENAFVYQLPAHAWPLRLRVGFDADGRVTQLYVYRADF